jgi:hypothetical protein
VRDKRQFHRTEFVTDVLVELEDGSRLNARSADVSPGGMFLHAEVTPSFSANVVLVCSLPRLPDARLPAVVRWTKEGGFGVQFGLLGARETHALNLVLRGSSPGKL